MRPERPLFHCSAFRIFPILFLLLLPILAAAQSAGNNCEPSAAVKEEIKKVNNLPYEQNKFTFPVLLGQAYAEGNGITSIPRNWVISVDGKLVFEGISFGGDGNEWLKKAVEMIEKVKANP